MSDWNSDWVEDIVVEVEKGVVKVLVDFETLDSGHYGSTNQGTTPCWLTPEEAEEMARCLQEAARFARESPEGELGEDDIMSRLGLRPKWDSSR